MELIHKDCDIVTKFKAQGVRSLQLTDTHERERRAQTISMNDEPLNMF